MKLQQCTTVLATMLLSSLFLTACNDSDDNDVVLGVTPPSETLTDCMWQDGPTSKSNTGADPRNFAYPDTNVNYWSSEFTIPEGAKVYLDGDYPYARHSSLVSYTSAGERVNSLRDFEIQPSKGVENPFLVGNSRLNKERGYTAEIKLGDLPAQPEVNTLYTPKTDSNEVAILYRVYVPNKGLDDKGGVSFPRYRVELADGKVIRGEEVCNVLQVKDRQIKNQNALDIYETVYNAYRPVFGKGYPARQEPKWFKTFNAVDNFKCVFQLYAFDGSEIKTCEGQQPPSIMNQWATPDNEYMIAATSRELGEVVVLRGKLPSTTKTYHGDAVVNASQLRYWSICTNEQFTSATNYCLYDEEITQFDKDGFYTIVVANKDDRPNNAIESCGITYLQQSERGDGFYTVPKNSPDYDAAKDNGHSDLGLLLVRNLLPSADFKQSLQNVTTNGTEKDILGDFAPDITYTTKAEFEALGCGKK